MSTLELRAAIAKFLADNPTLYCPLKDTLAKAVRQLDATRYGSV